MIKKLFVVLFACLAFSGAVFAATVDLNTATQAQLETVKGIGPVKAKAIIDYRAKNGPFKNIDDLDKVPGFGKKTVDSVRSQVTVGGGAAAGRMEKKPEAKPAEKVEKKPEARPEEKAEKKPEAKPVEKVGKKPEGKAAEKAERKSEGKGAEKKSAEKKPADGKQAEPKKTPMK